MNNQRKNNKILSDKYKIVKTGVLPNIIEDNITPTRQNENRNVYGTQNMNKTFYKANSANSANSNRINSVNNTYRNNSGNSNNSTSNSTQVRSKLNNSIQLSNKAQDSDIIKPIQLSLEVENVQIDQDTHNTDNGNSPVKHKGYNSKYSNFTNISTVDTNTSFICLSKDALTPYGTKSDLYNNIADKDMSEGLRKEIVTMKEQMESRISAQEKKFEELLVERKDLIEENEFVIEKLNGLNKSQDAVEFDLIKLNGGFNQSLNEIAKLESDQKNDIERMEVKMRLLEETLNKRNEKYSTLVKEQQQLTKNIDFNDKSRNECEKRIIENGDKLRKRLEDLNKSNNINQKDTIEML